ncbi:MAG TPA: rhodanese-like domain-containing protein [Polyangiaceae bacterium]|nr:rhodanese-like domain-containing protein [Polyangiaceae bacterium]
MSRADYEIKPEDLRQKLEAGERFVLLDVRRPDEVAVSSLPNAVHIPIDEIEERASELDANAETVVFCHHGVRSLSVTVFLRNLGFRDVTSLAGGIDLWSQRIDPSVPRY